MDTTSAPQIIEHIAESLPFTPFDTRWIPRTARFALMGQAPKATGVLELRELADGKANVIHKIETQFGLKCGSFGASDDRRLATGDYNGNLAIYDLGADSAAGMAKPVFEVKGAHDKIINCIDGIGGGGVGYGAPELVTGARDGCVKIWDPRTNEPVVSLEPATTATTGGGTERETPADCWTVGFGNSYNDDERTVVAGYDNGDVKVFDLRKMQLLWDVNVKNGVCHAQFDRRDVKMNKLSVCTLEAQMLIYDMRTYHPTDGYAGRREKVTQSTLWGVHHLPQNRDVFACLGGNGSVNLFKYHYPEQRSRKDPDGLDIGIVGTVELLNHKEVATQPIVSFDWHASKEGLAVMCGLDQSLKVVICTKLNLL